MEDFDDDDNNNLRASMLNEEAEQDRRLIMKKMAQRQRSIRLSKKKLSTATSGRRHSERSGFSSSQQHNDDDLEDSSFNESSTFNDEDIESINEEILYEVQAAHEQHAEDEEVIGGRMEYGDEGIDACSQALTSPPATWWAMRKQWQKRKGGNTAFNIRGLKNKSNNNIEYDGPSPEDGGGGDGGAHDPQDGNEGGIGTGPYSGHSASMRSRLGLHSGDSGVVGHPVMLEDPTSIGYDVSSFRTNPYATNPNEKKKKNNKRKVPSVMYVSRDALQKRKLAQIAYLVAAFCVICLFMFVLEQRKLSHYAMVDSPISLSAYLAGEEFMANRDEGVTMNDLGLEEFEGGVSVPEVEFGNIEVNPNDPLANEELANDPLVGNFKKSSSTVLNGNIMSGMDRIELLKGVIVGWGVTPSDILENISSPQFKALNWMANEDLLQYKPDDDYWIKKIVQRYVLVTLYYSTSGGEGWTDTLYFLSEKDECEWNGRTGNVYNGAGHCEDGFITSLALWSNNLDGGECMFRGLVNVYHSIYTFRVCLLNQLSCHIIHLSTYKKTQLYHPKLVP